MFGGWSIEEQLFVWLKNNLQEKNTIIEFGSGNSTAELIKLWNVFSVEENIDWVNKYHNQYIYAPLKDHWYDLTSLTKGLPKKYDLILVDGPAYGRRMGFFENFQNLNFENSGCKFLVFDDVERPHDFECYSKVCDLLRLKNIAFKTHIQKSVKQFAYIEIISSND
jgi:hypothetical protein